MRREQVGRKPRSLWALSTVGLANPAAGAAAFAGYNIGSATATAISFNAGTDSALAQLDAQHGGVGGVSVGFVMPARLLGLIDRVEAYSAFSSNDDSQNTRGFSFTATSADGRAALSLFDTDGIDGVVSLSERHREFGLRFKSDNFTDTAFPVIVSFEPFYRRVEVETDARVAADYALSNETDVNMYGVQLALETEVPLALQVLSFVGRVSGGIYAVDADAKASERVGTYTLSWSGGDDETGYRLGAEAGLRLQMNNSSFATLTGAVDHFSEAPSVTSAATAAAVTLADQTDYQVKLNLTFRTE